jgi:hypothetical protein
MLGVTLNSFLEDTSVLVALAFVLVRGPLQRVAANPVGVGVLAGVLGLSEAIFPEARYPYAPHALACAFATALGGWRAGLVAAGVTVIAAAALLPGWEPVAILIQTLTTIDCLAAFGSYFRSRWWAAVPAAMGQTLGIEITDMLRAPLHQSLTSFVTVPANAFGFVLLMLVVRDANLRADAERRQHERDEARRLAAEAQLAMLRSRIQPHFLFNALNSIAALCTVAPKRASEATVELGQLMRRSLEIDFGQGLSLQQELQTVRSYLAIEQERFGAKLRVQLHTQGCESVIVPAFGVQILVENAILHGISRKSGAGEIAICARRKGGHCVVAVLDDGPGPGDSKWTRETPHGLGILSAQLRASFGSAGRLHLLGRRTGGTIAAFQVPYE